MQSQMPVSFAKAHWGNIPYLSLISNCMWTCRMDGQKHIGPAEFFFILIPGTGHSVQYLCKTRKKRNSAVKPGLNLGPPVHSRHSPVNVRVPELVSDFTSSSITML